MLSRLATPCRGSEHVASPPKVMAKMGLDRGAPPGDQCDGAEGTDTGTSPHTLACGGAWCVLGGNAPLGGPCLAGVPPNLRHRRKEVQREVPLQPTSRRNDLSHRLHRLDRRLGDLYDHAIAELSAAEYSTVRLLIAGHCMRELVNNLPEALADVGDLPPWSDTRGPEKVLVAARTDNIWPPIPIKVGHGSGKDWASIPKNFGHPRG